MKNEVKTFYFGDHICTWTVISEKKGMVVTFPISVWPMASTVFINLARCVKSLPTLAVDVFNFKKFGKQQALSYGRMFQIFSQNSPPHISQVL